jgi:hypothetical protein
VRRALDIAPRKVPASAPPLGSRCCEKPAAQSLRLSIARRPRLLWGMKTSSRAPGRATAVGSVRRPSPEPAGTVNMRRKQPFRRAMGGHPNSAPLAESSVKLCSSLFV